MGEGGRKPREECRSLRWETGDGDCEALRDGRRSVRNVRNGGVGGGGGVRRAWGLRQEREVSK